jgi:Cytochrome c554 and c-prime
MARFGKTVWYAYGVMLILFCSGTFSCPCALAQLSTSDHLAEPGFWPTQDAASRKDFVGAQACGTCHAAIFASQRTTPMGATAMHVENSDILRQHPKLNFGFGPYRFEIKTEGDRTAYTVTDGKASETAALQWAFGTGQVGQSYLFKKQDDQKFYEARVTYFSSLKNLNFTPARAITSAKDVDEAMYREVDPGEVSRCFACHATASSIAGKFEEANLIPGVSCESCHGAGAQHIAAMRAAKLVEETGGDTQVFNPASLRPWDSVDFCGACHATAWDVKLSGNKGVSNARSQPYRLEKSKCWGQAGDARLTCIGCHDPHKQLQTEPSSYDKACLSCHAGVGKNEKAGSKVGVHNGAACPVATKDCVTCHMPKVQVPEMHYAFTDHRIRIVRPGDGYTD